MRTGEVKRRTRETQISVEVNLDGGDSSIVTGVGFFDHMLSALATHGGFGLKVNAVGDLEVDCHHTVEDTGIVLGQAFAKAFASVDVSGRPFLVFDGSFPEEQVGGFDTCMCKEFFRAFAFSAGLTLHVKVLYGENSHHMIEAAFKAVAHALKAACVVTDRKTVLSTKGSLD